jgi:rhodanese-related sulfurtransferase
MRKVSVNELERWTGKVIDVRNLDEYMGERMERAECVPLGRLLKAASAWDPSEPVLVMCKSGVRSEQAARQLTEAGFTEVAMLEGGIEACKQAGVHVVRQRAPMPIFRQVMVAAGLFY